MASAYIRNRCFNSRLNKTPFEAFTGSKPDLSKMHVFDCVCYGYSQNSEKLDPRSKQGIFVGYDKNSPAYLVYYPDINKVERVRCVKFFREGSKELPELDDEELAPQIAKSHERNPKTTNEDIIAPETSRESRYPTRIRSKPKYLDEYVTEEVSGEETVSYTVDYCYRVSNITTTYSQAISSNEKVKWQKAMNDERKALIDNDTFELVPPPTNRDIVGGKWVYTVKVGQHEEETHKDPLCSKGILADSRY
ncbi:uncharacterized protein LOC124451302 [Xenia sp. Carnegie-2017]|uniref:uncharacterized protein LOC124451302 n=1 Tax=Xenia sp. Carnegie-2017 TaxID=2897299 RepID=UPI001F04A359|nr:uncharacterized protein LOC124451302 [Xenia sp. Carnegie-2017]